MCVCVCVCVCACVVLFFLFRSAGNCFCGWMVFGAEGCAETTMNTPLTDAAHALAPSTMFLSCSRDAAVRRVNNPPRQKQRLTDF